MMKITRKEVAAKAGVSTATVSYVLNKTRKLSESTEKRVLDAVKELNYRPDLIAQSLKTRESRQVAIIVHDIKNPFFGDILLGFEQAALEHGYFVTICTGANHVEDYFENFISRSIDGVFVAAAPVKYHIDKVFKLLDAGIKVVMGSYPDASLKQVSIIENDYEEAAYRAVKYLHGLGHEKIAFLTCLHKSFSFDKRISGYLHAVEELALPIGDELIVEGNPTDEDMIQEGSLLTHKLIESAKKFTAVICLNDMMAIGCMSVLKERGFTVPHDVSVMGFDGIDFGEKWEPSLTTMSFPKKEWGKQAFDLLYNNMKKGVTGYYPQRLELIERNSTGRCQRL